MGNAPWKFHEPAGRDTDFLSTPLHKQGQELRSEQTVTPLHEQHHLYLFLRLNNSETLVLIVDLLAYNQMVSFYKPIYYHEVYLAI